MIKVPLLRHQRYISPLQLTSRVETNDKMYLKKNVDFDTFDGHVMVNFIEPNFQDIIFTLCTVSLITQKWFSDHLKKWHFLGNTPYIEAGSRSAMETTSSRPSSTQSKIQWTKPLRSNSFHNYYPTTRFRYYSRLQYPHHPTCWFIVR